MSLIIALGSNIEPRWRHLQIARDQLSRFFEFQIVSKIYESSPVDDFDQDTFLNQVIECLLPPQYTPPDVLKILQSIEISMGREKLRDKGPRNIDLDLIFYDLIKFQNHALITPHPQWLLRNFVLLPLKNDLRFFAKISHLVPTDQFLKNSKTHWTKIH